MKNTKIYLCAALLLILCLALAACAPGLPDGFDGDAVTAQAEQDVALINTRDFEAVVNRLRADLQDAVTVEDLETAWGGALDALGAYDGVKDTGTSGTKDRETGEAYAVAIVVAQYENGTATFTLSYDADLALVGLYMK